MTDKIKEIKKQFTKDFLVKTSQQLINLYKSKNFRLLTDIFNQLFPEENVLDHKKLFYRLIKLYHPDSLETHSKTITLSQRNGLNSEIKFIERMLAIKFTTVSRNLTVDYQHHESYGFDQGDYDYFSEDELEETEYDEDIISIITSLFIGNSRQRFEPVDLAQIDGELVLRELQISDLDGLQYCTNVQSLDLSYNHIENIFEIKDLHLIKDLDLSHNLIDNIDCLANLNALENLYLDENQIEDISPLLNLHCLQLVSIIGNPITSMNAIRKLQENDVVVLYY